MTVLALGQEALLARLSLLGARPDLVFAAVLAWGMLRGSAEGMVWAFIGGLVLDLLSGGPMGGMTLALLLIALLAGRRWGRELTPVGLQVFLLGLGLGFLYHLLLLTILAWSGAAVDWAYDLARVAAPSAIANGLLSVLLYPALAWLDRRTRAEGLTFDEA